MKLNDIGLIQRRVLKLSFKDELDENSKDIEGKEGFLQVGLNKVKGKKLRFNNEIFVMRFDATIKALIKDIENSESNDVKDALLIAQIDIYFEMTYKHSHTAEQVTKLVEDEEWFFQRDARIFINKVGSNVLDNSEYYSIRLPLG
ncbi:MAG: hypothetical protein ACI9LM_003319 [Alteromonadaceae bacterium]|jgi:hypothetical protein